MAYSYVVYIDEAGDDGIGKFRKIGESGQTLWLVLSAIIVTAANDRSMPAWRDAITGSFKRNQKRDLHFVDLNHDQAVFACRQLAQRPIGAISILSDKRTLLGHANERIFKKKNHLYKYMLRHLLERVSISCKMRTEKGVEGDGRAQIVFSRRGGMDYDDFRAYMQHLRTLQSNDGSWHPMEWSSIDVDGALAMDHTKRAGLQLADIVASAFHRAVEPSYFGNYEQRYAYELERIVLRGRDGKRIQHGIKTMQPLSRMSLDSEQTQFFGYWK